jgi:hypothetical protein
MHRNVATAIAADANFGHIAIWIPHADPKIFMNISPPKLPCIPGLRLASHVNVKAKYLRRVCIDKLLQRWPQPYANFGHIGPTPTLN